MKIKVLLFFLFFPGIVFGSNSLTINSNTLFNYKSGKAKLQKYPQLQQTNQILPFDINNNTVSDILNQKPENLTISNFPVSNINYKDIELNKDMSDYNRNTKVIVSENNKLRQVQAPKSIMYSGKIKDENGSFVTIVITNDILFGYIKHNNGELYSISPSKLNENNLHILSPHFSDDGLAPDERATFECLTDDYTGFENESDDIIKYESETLQTNMNKLLEAEIICDAAYDFYKLMGLDYDRTTAYIYSVMALTSKLYSEFLNIKLIVSDIYIRTDAASDPYQNYNNLATKLERMPAVWKSNPNDRAVVVLFADKMNQPPNTIIAGIAMGGTPKIGTICSKDRGYCVLGIDGNYKYPTFNYTWDVNVAAHEIGHNFSAPHTHNCYFAPHMIDTCVTKQLPFPIPDACVGVGQPKPVPGTIMSYCHVSNSTRTVELIFHPRVIPLMRLAAENCNCMSPSKVTLALLEPLGGTSFKSGEDINIRWASANVTNIDIYLSTDNGKTWTTQLGKGISTEDSILTITAPHINTDSALVKIVEVGDEDNYEESVLPFSIHYQVLSFIVPKEGDSFSKNEKLFSSWSQNFADEIKLEFTSDGGDNWVEFTKTIYNEYQAEPLGIESDNCKFRITSLEDNTQSESSRFSIGVPEITVLSPNGGEEWAISTTQEIKWESNNLYECFVEYSTNGGDNWKRIIVTRVPAADGVFNWTIPNTPSEEAMVRIRGTVSADNISDISNNVFKIYEDETVDVAENNLQIGNLSIESISPNPINRNTTINIINNSGIDENCELLIIDNLGQATLSFNNVLLPANSNIYEELDLSKISQGNYFVVLKSKTKSISYPINIIR